MLTPTPCNKQDSSEQCFAGDFLAEASIRFYPDPIQHYYGTMPPPHPMMHTNVAWSFDTHFVQPEFVHDGLVDPQSIFSSPKTAFNMVSCYLCSFATFVRLLNSQIDIISLCCQWTPRLTCFKRDRMKE